MQERESAAASGREGKLPLTARGQLRVLLFADSHLGFDYPVRPRIERRHRGQSFFDNYHRILDHAVRSRPDLVVHGGDMFFRTRVPARIVDMAYEALTEFAQNGIPVFLVPGNHESSRLPPSLWLGASNIYVFDRPRTFEINLSGHRVAVSGFPFARNDAGHRFKSLLAETDWQGTSAAVRLLCMHQAVEGAQFGPTNFTFRAGRDVVRMSDIPENFVAVLTGHIHRRQVLHRPRGRGRLPVIYPGSIERTSFAEKGEPKGFFEIDLAPDEAGAWWVEHPRFIQLPARPMSEILIDPEADSTSLRQYLIGRIAGLDQDSIVKLKPMSAIEGASRSRLTMPFFRSIFPGSMDIQLGLEFYREERRAPNHARE